MAKKQDETIIKNPSPEELDELRAKSETAAYRKTASQEQASEAGISVGEYQSDYLNTYEDLLKPKTDYFEPDPIPFRLPSGSFVVDKKYLTDKNEIFIRRLSAPEEKFFTKMKEKKDLMSSINKSLDAIIKTKNVSVNDLSLIDKLALFIYVIAITYGSTINIADKLDCKACVKEGSEKTKVIVNILDDLEIKYVPDDYEYPFKVKLNNYKDCDITVVYEYPTIRLENFFIDEEDSDVVEAIKSLIIDVYGKKANGNPVQKTERDGLLKFLSVEDRVAIRDKISDFSKYGIQLTTTKYSCTNNKCPFVSEATPINIGLDVMIEKMLSSVVKE